MVFRSQKDRSFFLLIGISITIVALVTILPIFLASNVTIEAAIILIGTLLLSVGLIIWPFMNMQYVLHTNFLLVKGGPFRSKILYKDIVAVEDNHDILTGYRILASKDSLEIIYRGGIWGSVKISPVKKQVFINELLKRNESIKIRTR